MAMLKPCSPRQTASMGTSKSMAFCMRFRSEVSRASFQRKSRGDTLLRYKGRGSNLSPPVINTPLTREKMSSASPSVSTRGRKMTWAPLRSKASAKP